MNILVVDVGGTHVKILVMSQEPPPPQDPDNPVEAQPNSAPNANGPEEEFFAARREFDSGPELTPHEMVDGVHKAAEDWAYDVLTIGFPGPVLRGRPVAEPHNLGAGWVGFDFHAAFGRPVKIVNDAAMQALGSYRGGRMLFLGLGTGLGSALILDGILEPLELAHLPFKKATFEDYVGARGLKRLGRKKWRRNVTEVIECLTAAVQAEDVVLGGGNVKKLKELPPGCRQGANTNAFLGGFRLWERGHFASTAAPPECAPAARPVA